MKTILSILGVATLVGTAALGIYTGHLWLGSPTLVAEESGPVQPSGIDAVAPESGPLATEPGQGTRTAESHKTHVNIGLGERTKAHSNRPAATPADSPKPDKATAGRFAYLPAEKRDRVATLISRYAAMIQDTEALANDSEHGSHEKLIELLRKQEEDTLTTLLTPEEKFEYDLRESEMAKRTRRLPMDLAEEEFRSIVWIEKWNEDQWNQNPHEDSFDSQELLQAREQAMRQVLGTRYEEYERVSDPYWESCLLFTQEQGLDPSYAEWLHQCHTRYAEASAAITRKADLSSEDRNQELAALQDHFTKGIRPYLGQKYDGALNSVLFWLNQPSTPDELAP